MRLCRKLVCRPSGTRLCFTFATGTGVPGFLCRRFAAGRNKDEQIKPRRARLAWTAGGGCPYVICLTLGFVFFDHAVPDGDDTVRVLGDVVFMRHEDDCIAFRVQAVKQRHDLVASL